MSDGLIPVDDSTARSFQDGGAYASQPTELKNPVLSHEKELYAFVPSQSQSRGFANPSGPGYGDIKYPFQQQPPNYPQNPGYMDQKLGFQQQPPSYPQNPSYADQKPGFQQQPPNY